MAVVNFSFSVKEPQVAFALRTILDKFQVENMQETVVEDEEIEIPELILNELHRRVEKRDRTKMIDSENVRKKAKKICASTGSA